MTTKDRTRFCTEIQKKHGQKITFAIVSLFVAIHLGSTVLSALSFAVAAMPGIGSILALAIMVFLFAGIYALHTGFCFIMIKLIRNQSAILGDLLAPFRNFKRTLRNSLPFVVIALATSFAAAMIIIASGTFEQMLRILENPEAAVNFPASFSIIIYAMFFVTLLLNLPLIYLPFFDFDMQKKPHKEVRSNAFAFQRKLKAIVFGHHLICRQEFAVSSLASHHQHFEHKIAEQHCNFFADHNSFYRIRFDYVDDGGCLSRIYAARTRS